ncbi:MAG: hypothetical protein LBU29_02105 [Endomicrobium sp.]|nr:hypothetical protein [Endomicrobium sp.]
MIVAENVICRLKRFKIVPDKIYRNKRKRFGLRFNLKTGMYNFALSVMFDLL